MEDEAPVPDPREMFRRLLELDPEELEELVRLLERERQDAAVALDAAAQQVEDVLRDVLRPGASSEADAPGQPPASVPPATP